MSENALAVLAVGISAAGTALIFLISFFIGRGSSLTKEQRARRTALREARTLCRANGTDPTPHEIERVARFILGGE